MGVHSVVVAACSNLSYLDGGFLSYVGVFVIERLVRKFVV
jgi:hypothetical protein